ncbi:MAG: GNAT family N-acetyltransferase [Prolixibacteraceae bacterium]|jgi:ribosomal protein S18 acetylase RimI-like enzyme|nr:GNAT family N-acetyltransferase [Prolixibacteraceae bacterium]
MNFSLAGKYFYGLYRNSLCDLYINTFSQKPVSQYHNRKTTLIYFDSLFEHGFGVFATKDHRLCGALLAVPLSLDKNLPEKIAKNYDVNKSFYIAEMMVDELYRGQGIGRNLIIKYFNELNTNCVTHVFIRVWGKNATAIKLYDKMGFKPVTSVVQAALRADKSGMRDFRKTYMVKESQYYLSAFIVSMINQLYL